MKFEITERNIEALHHCPLCHLSDTLVIGDVSLENGLTFFSTDYCPGCGYIFRKVRPTTAWYQEAFEQRNTDQKNRGFKPINETIEKDRYYRYDQLGRYLRDTIPDARSLLDVGCGPGTGLIALQERGFVPAAIEPDISRGRIAQTNGFEVFCGGYELYKPLAQFDIVTSIHSLEHFHRPADFLDRVHEFLRPGGILLLEVPNFECDVKDWNDLLYLGHLNNFREDTLKALCQSKGWRCVERGYPYRKRPLGEIGMVFLFRAIDNSISEQPLGNVARDEQELLDVQNIYSSGLPEHVTVPFHIVVPEINDLSLTYRVFEAVEKKYQLNQAGRSTFVKDNQIFVN